MLLIAYIMHVDVLWALLSSNSTYNLGCWIDLKCGLSRWSLRNTKIFILMFIIKVEMQQIMRKLNWTIVFFFVWLNRPLIRKENMTPVSRYPHDCHLITLFIKPFVSMWASTRARRDLCSNQICIMLRFDYIAGWIWDPTRVWPYIER